MDSFTLAALKMPSWYVYNKKTYAPTITPNLIIFVLFQIKKKAKKETDGKLLLNKPMRVDYSIGERDFQSSTSSSSYPTSHHHHNNNSHHQPPHYSSSSYGKPNGYTDHNNNHNTTRSSSSRYISSSSSADYYRRSDQRFLSSYLKHAKY